MPRQSPEARIHRLATRRQILHASDVRALGLHTQILSRMVAQGSLERVAPGQYRRPGARISEHHDLVIVANAVPNAVVCLLSALSFHSIGTQSPWQIWIALDRATRTPRLDRPPLRVVHFSGSAFSAGIETHRIEGAPVRIYGVAKTIVDCFKYRNKVGLDVALEALREGWRARRFTMDELYKLARACRVSRVMQPYLESLA
jgi:predicted transcriptional regulator of viral defense system